MAQPSPDSSSLSFHTADHQVRDRGDNEILSNLKDAKNFQQHWKAKTVSASLAIPYLPGKDEIQPKPAVRNSLNAPSVGPWGRTLAPPPFECIICLGLIMQATVPSCGHMFCKECIEGWKKRFNACPICYGSLSTLSRVYAVDKLMEEYFLSPFASPEDRDQYLTFQESRVKELLSEAKSRKESYFLCFYKAWNQISISIQSKGILHGTIHIFRCLIYYPRFLIPKNVLILCGGIAFGIVLDRLIFNYVEGSIYFVQFWWDHTLNGIRQYYQQTHAPPKSSAQSFWGRIQGAIFG